MLLTDYTSGGPSGSSYNVTVIFEGTQWTEDLQQAFVASADYISTVIIGDLDDVYADFGDGQGFRWVDDLEITATLDTIDGVNGTLGQAGPTYIRTSSSLPILAEMTFDVADAQNLYDGDVAQGTQRWDDVVLHEMLHSVGIGSLWETMGLVVNYGTTTNPDYRYTGNNAMFEYEKLFPTIYADDPDAALGVPVESGSGSAGTDGSHWDEATFGNELMTGYIDGTNPISNMTIAALEDMGYATTYIPSCFVEGSLIETATGYKPIEALLSGDLIITMDRGLQPLRFVVVETYSKQHLEENERHRPIRIKEGSFGHDRSYPPLFLSPQHRVYVTGRPVHDEIGELSALVPIKDALELQGVRRMPVKEGVSYYHLIFDKHNIVRANGIWCESFLRSSMMPARRIVQGAPARRLMRKMRHSLKQENQVILQEPYFDSGIANRT